MPGLCAALAILLQSAPQPPMGALIAGIAAVLVAIIGVVGNHVLQAKKLEAERVQQLERFDQDLTGHAKRLETLEAALKACNKKSRRMARIETDLLLFFTTRDTSKVMRALIDVFTERLGVEPTKSVILAMYLRRVAEDEMLKRMTELSAATPPRAEIERLFEEIKAGLKPGKGPMV